MNLCLKEGSLREGGKHETDHEKLRSTQLGEVNSSPNLKQIFVWVFVWDVYPIDLIDELPFWTDCNILILFAPFLQPFRCIACWWQPVLTRFDHS